jgi:hypothetical protein
MNYDVDYFIAKFEAIPEEMWITEDLWTENGCCALGHCGARRLSEVEDLPEAAALVSIFKPHISRYNNDMCDDTEAVWCVNDQKGINGYNQPTPKQRILAALRDIKAKQGAACSH